MGGLLRGWFTECRRGDSLFWYRSGTNAGHYLLVALSYSHVPYIFRPLLHWAQPLALKQRAACRRECSRDCFSFGVCSVRNVGEARDVFLAGG